MANKPLQTADAATPGTVQTPQADADVTTPDPVDQTTPVQEPEDREEQVRQAAYRRYQQRGDGSGSAEQDWLEAESELGLPVSGRAA